MSPQAVFIGEAAHPLRSLLQSQQLSQSLTLPVHNVEGARRELCLLRVRYDTYLMEN